MYKKVVVGAALASLLTGCGTKEICPSSTRVELPQAEVAAKNSESLKVIVLPVDMSFKDAAGKKLKSVLRKELEAQVYNTGTTLVDRKLADKLKGEIKLAEQSGRYNTNGVPIADYAILTEIGSSDLSHSFSEAYSYKNKKGETVRVPAKCSYKAEVTAVAKVVSLPDMGLVERIELSGKDYMTTETRNSSCPMSNAGYTAMISDAAQDAVDDSRTLKKLLAPSAMVLELRQCEAGNQVRISMGTNKKIQPKMDVIFVKQEKYDGTIETRTYGEGSVVNNPNDAVKSKYSWIEVDDKVVMQLEKGDQVKVDALACDMLDLGCMAGKL